MGQNLRYANVRMFDTPYRVMLEATDGSKDELVCGADDFPDARAAYARAIADYPKRVVLLMQRSRIVEKSPK